MRATRVLEGIAATAIVAAGSLGLAPIAQADNDWGVDISGTWRVLSDGEWARTNEVLIDQRTVLETWTVNVSCVSPIECSGEVKSDLGWTGTARLDDYWYIEHDRTELDALPQRHFRHRPPEVHHLGVGPRNRAAQHQELHHVRRPQCHQERQRRLRR